MHKRFGLQRTHSTNALKKLGLFLVLFQQAFANLKNNDPIRMAAATAFFSFFALPPSIIIVSQVLSVLFNDAQPAVSGRLFRQLSELLGARSANQLQDISKHLEPQKADGWLTFVSIAILLIASTTLFQVIKNSLNQLWNVKMKDNQSSILFVRNRGIALAIIIASGFLFTASLAVGRLLPTPTEPSPLLYVVVLSIGRYATSVVTLTCWFALLFKYLPDVRVRWVAVWVGSLVTAVLFTMGEGVLTLLLTDQQMQAVHGRSGAITLVLLMVFYCSLIFYYGAAFTRQFALWAELAAVPADNAIGYEITEVDASDNTVQ
ncbi:YihY/virulence factor BrkB family protein [Fibrella aquatica]|uniref:YihY/virulence factor BrkB family protein n=1 Tax=Fibrella aquatica TaxID=3242487 RepID=UPI0035218FF4